MTTTATDISEADHAKLVALLDERRKIERKRKLAKARSNWRALSLAQKLEADAPYKERLAELNRQIDEILNQGGETK